MSSGDFIALAAVAGSVSRETFLRLQSFQELFLKWNRSINLAAPSTLGDIWRRHVLDSAQLAVLAPKALNWADLGSGGGFPGLVLGFLLADRPGAAITLVESNRKKAAFLQAVVGHYGLPARIVARRIEDAPELVSGIEMVTARALAPLNDLLFLSEPWLSSGARGLFHKGRDYRNEISETSDRWSFDLVEHPSQIDPHSVILEVAALKRNERSHIPVTRSGMAP